MMLFYSTTDDGFSQPLFHMIHTTVSEQHIEVCRSFGSLYRLFCRPGFNPGVAVLICGGKEELENIVSLRDLMLGKRIVLILPDHDPDTISKAHKLGPRFLGYADSAVEHVGEVVKKMAETLTSRLPGSQPINFGKEKT